MSRFEDNSIDIILTSPPFNLTSRKGGYADKTKRYDEYVDWKDEPEYLDWSVSVFKEFERILKKDRVIIYNFSYSIENPALPYKLVNRVIEYTGLTIADTIIWKKANAIPHPASYNRLNRIVEFWFIFCRKVELKSFKTFKTIKKIGKNGQKYFEIVDNFISARNNDGKCDLNKATFSTEIVDKLLKIYSCEGDIIYDPFIGTGTTAISALKRNSYYIGSELSEKQCEFAEKRINEYEK
jgi:DNA modification methylase